MAPYEECGAIFGFSTVIVSLLLFLVVDCGHLATLFSRGTLFYPSFAAL